MTKVKGDLTISFKRSISPDLRWEFLHFFENGEVDLTQVELRCDFGEYQRDELTFEEGIELAAEWLKADSSISATYLISSFDRTVEIITI